MTEHNGICVDMHDFYTLVVKGGLSIREAAEHLSEPYHYTVYEFHYSDVFQRIEAINIDNLVVNVERIGIERFRLGRSY